MADSNRTDEGESQANRELLKALTSRTGGQLRLAESYEGVVKHVGKDEVVVVYEQGDDLVEHTYTRDQFLNSELPERGARLKAYVHVVQLPIKPEDDSDTTSEDSIEQRRRRRNIRSGSREF